MWLTHFWHSWSQFFIFAWDVTAGGILRTGVLIYLVDNVSHMTSRCTASISISVVSPISRFLGPTWGPPGDDRTQVGPVLAPWTLLSGVSFIPSTLYISLSESYIMIHTINNVAHMTSSYASFMLILLCCVCSVVDILYIFFRLLHICVYFDGIESNIDGFDKHQPIEMFAILWYMLA